MPGWVDEAVATYSKRFPPDIKLDIKSVPLAQRGKDKDTGRIKTQEGQAMRKLIPPRDRVIALDVKGRAWSTGQLAEKLAEWQMSADNYSLLIGGPDGLDPGLLGEVRQSWSLSPLTLPHPLVRVILVEQLYRAWTINAGHPYHRN
jgi:23S rRNA (pseudouridine1915-N3)-methyltransferase